MRCALINTETGIVENIIMADPLIDEVPRGYLLLKAPDRVNIGWRYKNKKWLIDGPDKESIEAFEKEMWGDYIAN